MKFPAFFAFQSWFWVWMKLEKFEARDQNISHLQSFQKLWSLSYLTLEHLRWVIFTHTIVSDGVNNFNVSVLGLMLHLWDNWSPPVVNLVDGEKHLCATLTVLWGTVASSTLKSKNQNSSLNWQPEQTKQSGKKSLGRRNHQQPDGHTGCAKVGKFQKVNHLCISHQSLL